MSLDLSLENDKPKISAKAYLTIDDRVAKNKNKQSGNNQSGRSSLTKMAKKNKK